MEKHTCKLCSRGFSNGRALGGHMRSHVTTKLDSPSSSSSSSDAGVDFKVGPLAYALRENPKKSIRLLSGPDFGSSSVDVQDVESGSESQPEPKPEEQDVAISLMMLSRDSWTAVAPRSDGRSGGGEAVGIRPVKGGRSKYQCGTCKRVFRSYQALGGHRASHKKTNGCRPVKGDPTRIGGIREAEHECPVCYRVFSSGQALGGHKRSHLVVGITNINNNDDDDEEGGDNYGLIGSSNNNKSLIDLNLPAPMEDDAELSVVSDAEFVMGAR